MAMTKTQHFNPQSLLVFSFAAFLCPIVTAGFQEPPFIGKQDWMRKSYNLQSSEPTFSLSSWTAQLQISKMKFSSPGWSRTFDAEVDGDEGNGDGI